MINKTVARYWAKHYTDDEGFCVLCNGTGFVDPKDIFQADPMPCICPNGQDIRANYIVIESEG